ncbi:MAG TPA: class I SAM-dependent methyltransferase [Bryobacteraceae bacterium]|nr:class I SAM-dependent methyltransferase [Bryobacteraceae bacterium]
MTASVPEHSSSPYVFKAEPNSSHSILLNLLPENGSGRRVLDLGCAGGYLSRLLAERGYSVTAVDVPGSPPPALPSSVSYLEADLDQGLPRVEDHFDFVICADLLEHLRNPDRLLRDIREQMKPGGMLVGSLPNSGNIYFRLNVLFGRFPMDDRGLFDRTHVHFYMWRGWNELLERNGFRITTVRPTVIPFSLALPGSSGVGRAVESVYALLARAWKKLFAYQFVVLASMA